MKNYICPKCGKQRQAEFVPLCRDCRCAFVEKPYDLDAMCLELLADLDKAQSENERMIILRGFVGNAYVTAKEIGRAEAVRQNPFNGHPVEWVAKVLNGKKYRQMSKWEWDTRASQFSCFHFDSSGEPVTSFASNDDVEKFYNEHRSYRSDT